MTTTPTRPALATLALSLSAAVVLSIGGCIQREPTPPTPPAVAPTPVLADSGAYQITHGVTIDGVGAARGIFAEGNFIYVLGDLDADGSEGPGVIVEFFLSTGDDGRQTLFPSGRRIELTEADRDIAPHPTGLAWHPNFGYWLGDASQGRARLFQIDFARALSRGNLDGSVLHQVEDDAAVNGTRPMFLTLPGGRVALATSDDGDQTNAIRLYDPLALLAADRTSTMGVLFSEAPCGEHVQSLASRGRAGELWLVQTQTATGGYRLTEVTLDGQGDMVSENVIDFDQPSGDLQGLLWMEPDRQGRTPFILVSANPQRNIYFGRRLPPSRYTNPIQRQLAR